MKKNKIDVLDGFGKLKPGKKVDVTDKTQKTEYSADHIIIAEHAHASYLTYLKMVSKK
jgi:dihydrolipoamide dehydrogenase